MFNFFHWSIYLSMNESVNGKIIERMRCNNSYATHLERQYRDYYIILYVVYEN